MEQISQWWKEAVIYQIYPRSYKDSNGDGIGDLQGIISELDYIASLGVDAVWITPVFASPDYDNGYDISDYMSIQPVFGRMEDMEALIAALHERGIRLIVDMVINHTSHEHPWFKEACVSRDSEFYGYYHWWPAANGEPPYRIGLFDGQGKGWKYNEATDSWYLHYFSAEQPDLNWENERMRHRMYEIFRFWLDKGVDGFRLDAATFISKDDRFPPFDPVAFVTKYRGDWGDYYADGPHLHAYLREIREVMEPYGALSIAEAPGVPAERALEFVSPDRKELDMLTHFDGIKLGYLPGEFKKMNPAGYNLDDFKKVYGCWSDVLREKGWGSIYLGSHDQPRMVSRWGNDSEAFREVSAKMLFTFLLTMRATPFIYNGDELGMKNIRFETIEEYRDIETRRMYRQIMEKGGDTAIFLEDQREAARDNSRTPFQWNDRMNAGFGSGEPWIPIHADYRTINREAAEKDPRSILHYVRRLISLRKVNPVLIYGDYALVSTPECIYAYTRKYQGQQWLVVMHFSAGESVWHYDLRDAEIMINNYDKLRIEGDSITLQPYQALVMRLDV